MCTMSERSDFRVAQFPQLKIKEECVAGALGKQNRAREERRRKVDEKITYSNRVVLLVRTSSANSSACRRVAFGAARRYGNPRTTMTCRCHRFLDAQRAPRGRQRGHGFLAYPRVCERRIHIFVYRRQQVSSFPCVNGINLEKIPFAVSPLPRPSVPCAAFESEGNKGQPRMDEMMENKNERTKRGLTKMPNYAFNNAEESGTNEKRMSETPDREHLRWELSSGEKKNRLEPQNYVIRVRARDCVIEKTRRFLLLPPQHA